MKSFGRSYDINNNQALLKQSRYFRLPITYHPTLHPTLHTLTKSNDFSQKGSLPQIGDSYFIVCPCGGSSIVVVHLEQGEPGATDGRWETEGVVDVVVL